MEYSIYGDENGVAITGEGGTVIGGLADDASLKVSDAGTYVVNGTTLEPEDGDIIIGRYGETDAYIYDPEHALIRRNTPLEGEGSIAEMTGIDFGGASNFGGPRGEDPDPLTKAESDAIFGASSTVDRDVKAKIWIDNDGVKEEQELDLTPYDGAKQVTMYETPLPVAFNNEGGNWQCVNTKFST